ncbi:MAG: glycosyltransferase family 9 protein, partial [Gemmataceae bacterium]
VRRLAARHGRVVVTGGPAEKRQAAELLAGLRSDSVASLVGAVTLEQAVCVYARAGLVVSGDTGPLHVADAVGTRVVALFGPTLAERTGPWNQPGAVLCGSRPAGGPSFRTDRTAHHLEAIGVASVEASVEAALRSAA